MNPCHWPAPRKHQVLDIRSKTQHESETRQITWVEFDATPAILIDIETTHTHSQQNPTSKEDQ